MKFYVLTLVAALGISAHADNSCYGLRGQVVKSEQMGLNDKVSKVCMASSNVRNINEEDATGFFTITFFAQNGSPLTGIAFSYLEAGAAAGSTYYTYARAKKRT